MKYIATLNGKKYEVQIEKVPDYQPLSYEEAVNPVRTQTAVYTQTTAAQKPQEVPSQKVQKSNHTASANKTDVVSPMPGSIFDIKVAPGQKVKLGQVLFILEAMKMENEIVSPADGTVTSILVKKGDVVETDTVLATIK